MTAGEKTTVIASAKTAIDNAIAAYFRTKTVDAETRGYLTVGTDALRSLKTDVEAELTTSIVVNE